MLPIYYHSDYTPGLQVPVLLKSLIGRLPLPPIPHGTEGLIETIWLLMTSVVAVPAICKLPGGSPVLGFLVSLCLCSVCLCGRVQHLGSLVYYQASSPS